jgi:hypothetical protein
MYTFNYTIKSLDGSTFQTVTITDVEYTIIFNKQQKLIIRKNNNETINYNGDEVFVTEIGMVRRSHYNNNI